MAEGLSRNTDEAPALRAAVISETPGPDVLTLDPVCVPVSSPRHDFYMNTGGRQTLKETREEKPLTSGIYCLSSS